MKIKSYVVKTLAALCAGVLSIVLLSVCVGIGIFLYFDVQPPGDVAGVSLSEPMRIYTADGELIRKFGAKKRLPVSYARIPDVLVAAFVSAEDDRFFEHPGVDYQGIIRAGLNLVRTGTKSQGGSTITMQLARDLYLSPKRTYVRKIKEIILALKIESKLTKQQILQLYLNKIYLGSGAYGVGAAAKVYFDTDVSDLTLAQAALIAGLPKAPTTYSPINNPELARQRRGYVLGRMLETGRIDQAAYDRAMQQPIKVADHGKDKRLRADYVAEMVRQAMLERYGDMAYTAGFKVYTTISSDRQRAAMTALRKDLLAYDARHKWHGARNHLDADVRSDDARRSLALAALPHAGGLIPAVVMAVSGDTMTLQTRDRGKVEIGAADNPWLKKGGAADKLVSRGDVVRLMHRAADDADDGDQWTLAQIPDVQGALVALNPHDGSIQALTGGFDHALSKFNRAVDAHRQTGSSIKPFVYAAALANGFTAASLINDAPVVYGVHSDKTWRPENYGHRINGPTRLREGVVHSKNLMTIRLLRAVGIGTTIDYLARFGLPRKRMPHDLTLALGSADFTPMQMAGAYAVMANGGYRVKPYLIKRITGSDGKTLFTAHPAVACRQADGCVRPDMFDADDMPEDDTEAENTDDDAPKYAPRVITADNAYIIDDIMHDVIQRGTGQAARSLGRSDLSGKTGTTDDTVDAWFAGFNTRLVTVAWVGYDTPRSLGYGETGAHAALPMWISFMREALDGVPTSVLPRPDNIVEVKIDPETGQLALNGKGMSEIFTRDTAPTREEAREYRGFNPSKSHKRLF